MGIINPRPAMRRGEERRIHLALARHDVLYRDMQANGVDSVLASKVASDIVSTTKRRKAIWRAKGVS